MAKSTRFATTVTTRNLVTPQGVDGFFLDGRASGPRDARGVDSTLDREDRGFFYALYSNAGTDVNQIAQRNQKHLNKIFQDMKTVNRSNIDQEINELADCAVNIAGRLTISDTQQAPYFTGIVVKDGEMAAITSGRGCAYLYRNDILYPLTKDEYPLSEVNLQGEPVKNLELYCAGLAGTIRYSNIAQLQPDDCFILTNKEVMETLGHHQMLSILEDCFDQHDAAQRVADEMARRNPGATMQFMIGFVENITTLDKAGLKSLTGRMGWTQKSLSNLAGMGEGAGQPPISSSQPFGGAGTAAAVGAAAVGTAAAAQGMAAQGAQPGYTQLGEPTSYAPIPPQQAPQPIGQEAAYYQQQTPYQQPYQQPYPQERAMLGGIPAEEGLSTTKKIIIGVMIALIVILVGLLCYQLFIKGRGATPQKTTAPSRSVPAAVLSTNPKKTSLFPSKPKKTEDAFSSTPKRSDRDVKEPNSTREKDRPSSSRQQSSNPSVANPTGGGREYTVKDGDTVWAIAVANANGTDIDAYIKKVVAANRDKATSDGSNLNIFPGDKIVIPAP